MVSIGQMATGDLRGNFERLRMQLLSISYPHPLDVQSLKQGIPAVVLPLLHYALLGFSRHVARYLSSNGYELYARSDLRFMESVLRFFRQEFNYRCALTIAQIFSKGYAERKLIFIHDAIQMSKRKHNDLVKLGREKKIDKAELTQINYDTMSGFGLEVKNMKSPRACEVHRTDHLPSRTPKPWEHALRSSKISIRYSKDPECVHGDIPVVPVSEPTSPWPRNFGNNAEHHQHGMSTDKENTIKSRESPIGSRAIRSTDRVKKQVTYQEDLADIRSPASSEFSEEDHTHQEICRRIMDMAEKLEARFSTLEAGVTRAQETLQEKLVSLEGRVRNLETCKHEQKLAHSVELPRRKVKGQSVESVTTDLSQLGCTACPSTCRTRDRTENGANEQRQMSTCTTLNLLQPECYEHAWSLDHNIKGSRHCALQNLTNHSVGTSHAKLCEEYTSSGQQERGTSTRDFIAGVRARFNRTLELLSQEAQMTNSAGLSC